MSENTNDEDLTGLKNKVNELHALLKQEKARAEKAERDKEEAAEAATNANATELERMQKRAEKAERDLKAANERADASGKSLRDYKRDAAISAAIAAANVDSQHVAILTKALRGDVEFDDAGEPTIGGKSINDYSKSFFAKEGAGYVRAADHNGGGASGSDGSKARTWSKPPESPEELHNWMRFSVSNKEEAVVLSKSWGRVDLSPL